ncbi:MAG TPA: polysaccharide deacetylase family protein [Candidatus Elarobacter sp.]|nr:polysaccharide deacetylase family protein [Candidatus Elarobacter sp.]
MLRNAGVFRLLRDSEWRRQRLLILCYHGISLEDEHQWRPGLYMAPSILEQRLELLREGDYNVLPLSEGLKSLYAGELPPRSVSITFDDGPYDFYKQAYPRLKQYGFPVTVYQTTYYSYRQLPVFNLICSYLLWKRKGTVLDNGAELGLKHQLDLRTEASRQAIVTALMDMSEKHNLSGEQKNQLACRLAKMLGIDYAALMRTRILHLMNACEIAELSRDGVDFQLHTHRHTMPTDQSLFQREIKDNRACLQRVSQHEAVHFCYPSGVYDQQFLPWLKAAGVISATTCDVGLATSRKDSLLLPRFIDTSGCNGLDFESWLTGVGDLLAIRRAAPHKYASPGD